MSVDPATALSCMGEAVSCSVSESQQLERSTSGADMEGTSQEVHLMGSINPSAKVRAIR